MKSRQSITTHRIRRNRVKGGSELGWLKKWFHTQESTDDIIRAQCPSREALHIGDVLSHSILYLRNVEVMKLHQWL